jgi:type I restriction enzyme S subunit
VFASYLIRVRLPPEISPRYLYSFFHSKGYWDQVIFRGNAQPNANAQVLGDIVFPVAPLGEQDRIAVKLGALFAAAETIDQAVTNALRRAEHADQAVLARAFRGEL